MPLMKTPRIKGVVLDVPDAAVEAHLRAGWEHLLDEGQRNRLAELELEVELDPGERHYGRDPVPLDEFDSWLAD